MIEQRFEVFGSEREQTIAAQEPSNSLWWVRLLGVMTCVALLVFSASAIGGALTGSVTGQPGSKDLTSEGTSDWVHWGRETAASVDRKAGVPVQISDYVQLGTRSPNRHDDARTIYGWSDGTPTAIEPGTATGIHFNDVGNGYRITAPADTVERILSIYLGGYQSRGHLVASIDDGTTPDFAIDLSDPTTIYDHVATFTYTADSAGKTLTVEYSLIPDPLIPTPKNITLQAATLHTPSTGGNSPPTFDSTAPTAAAVGEQYTYNVVTSDVDVGDTLTLTVLVKPDWLMFTGGSVGLGTLMGSPGAGDVGGDNTVLLKVVDQNGGSATQSFTVDVAPAAGGALSVNDGSVPASVDLAALGTTDWAHWGHLSASSYDHKAGATEEIGNFEKIGPKPVLRHDDALAAYSWSGGVAPNVSVTDTTTGVHTPKPGNGFRLVVPAGTTERTLTLYIGGYMSRGAISASLSDGSAPDYVGSIEDLNGVYLRKVEFVYTASAENQTLTVEYTVGNTEVPGRNVTLQSATLSEDAGGTPEDRPSFTSLPVESSTQDQAYSYSITATDPNAGEALTITAPTSPNWLQITDNGGGSADLNSLPGRPSNDDVGEHNVTLRVQDAAGNFDTQSFVVTVANINDPPAFESIPVDTAVEGGLYSYAVVASDPDFDTPAGDTLTIAAAAMLPDWMALSSTVNGTATLSGIPDASDLGPNPVELEVRDIAGATAPQPFVVTVSALGSGPVVSVTSIDASGTSVDLTTQGSADWAHWGESTPSSFNHKSGVVQQISDFTQLPGQPKGPARFSDALVAYTWSDGVPPTTSIGSPGTTTGVFFAGVGNGYSFTVSAGTTRRTLNLYLGGYRARGKLTLTVSGSGLAPWEGFFENQTTVFARRISIDFEAASENQTLTVRYEADELFPSGNVTLMAATLGGSAQSNEPPVANGDSGAVAEGGTVNIDLADDDTDSDDGLDLASIVITGPGPSNGSVVVKADGTVDYTHDDSETTSDSFTYTIKDMSGATSNEATVDVTVTPVNDLPVANNDSATVDEGGSVNIDLANDDSDADDGLDLASIVITGPGPSNGTLALNADGTVDYDHGGASTASDSFTYTIDDLSGATSNEATVNVFVNAVSGGPTLSGSASDDPTAGPFDLTALGTGDWGHWGRNGDSSFNHKAGVGQQISDLIRDDFAGLPGPNDFGDAPTGYTWMDGTPTLMETAGTTTGVFFVGNGNGFELEVAAGPTRRTLHLFVGGFAAVGHLTLTLGDGSASPYLESFGDDAGSVFWRHVTVQFEAASSTTLTVRYEAEDILAPSGNVSLMAAAVTGAPRAMLPITESFDADNPNGCAAGWTLVDNTTSGPADWQVANGVLEQLAYVENRFEGDGLEGTYQRGTYCYYNPPGELVDYRFSAELTSDPDGANYNNALGMLFRYVDDDHFYRVSLNARYGNMRLEKRVGGVFSTLATACVDSGGAAVACDETDLTQTVVDRAVDARGYTPGQTMRIGVEVVGDLILVYVDDAYDGVTFNGEARMAARDPSLASGTVGVFAQDAAFFDNVAIEAVDTGTPVVIVAAPGAYTVHESGDLIVTAVARNAPAGSTLDFLLDSTACNATPLVSTSGVYTANCGALTAGTDYTVTATLNDGGASPSDTSPMVGAGDDRVTAGDSVTNGVGDRYALDNKSKDGRIIAAQGFQANLSNQASTALDVPQIVYNEGVGGDSSFDFVYDRLDSILERYPDAGSVIMMIGINDAGGSGFTPSGAGCSYSDPPAGHQEDPTGIPWPSDCAGTLKGNLQWSINKITAAGKVAIVPTLPPAWGNNQGSPPYDDPASSGSRNQRIQTYNQMILTGLSGQQAGASTYAFYLGGGENRFTLFNDNLHLNGLGAMTLGYLKSNALESPEGDSLPFMLEGICARVETGPTPPPSCVITPPATVPPPVLYKQNLMEVGDEYYRDGRDPDFTATLVSIPAELDGGVWISTDDAHRDNALADYLTFAIDLDELGYSSPYPAIDVYVLFDAAVGAVSLPGWLQEDPDPLVTGDFEPVLGQQVLTTHGAAPALNLYKRTYPGSSLVNVTLGGAASGSTGAAANYLVVVKPVVVTP